MKQRIDSLIKKGHKVFLSYDGPAFETRQRTSRSGYRITISKMPREAFQEWMKNTAGPRGILWTTEKVPAKGGINVYFYKSEHALLAKLTWGGA